MNLTIFNQQGNVVYTDMAEDLVEALRPMFFDEQSEDVKQFAEAMNSEWEKLRLESCSMLSDEELVPDAFENTLKKFNYNYVAS